MDVSASRVKMPHDMIAMGILRWVRGFLPQEVSGKIAQFGSIGNVHSAGANMVFMVFCDGHVEYSKQSKWTEESPAMRKRWNNDNEPHSETW
jgi:hypothetical protein